MEKVVGQTESLRERDIIDERSESYIEGIPVASTDLQGLESRVYRALQRYSNIHRGAGQHSQITTKLFEIARHIVLRYLGLDSKEYIVVFGSTRRLHNLKHILKKTNNIYQIFSADIGLPLGVGAFAMRKDALPKGAPFPKGGGVVKLVSRRFVIWEDFPARLEAGTPNIIGVIAFAVALKMISISGNTNTFQNKSTSGSANTILYNDHFGGCSRKKLLSKLRESIVGGGTVVPTSIGFAPYINFDNAASTQTFEAIWDVVRKTWNQSDGVLKDIIEEVKKLCLRFFHASKDQFEIIFTQNATEGINIVAEALKNSSNKDKKCKPVVLSTILEHNSNELPWRYLHDMCLLRFPVDKEGFIDLEQIERILCDFNRKGRYRRKRIELLAISGCSNVIGTINDIESISIIAHKYGARILVDAAQLAAHRVINIKKANIDYLVFSGHKMYAPFGAGGLVFRKGLLSLDDSVLYEIESSGRKNAVGIAAMGKAMELLSRVGMNEIAETERHLTRRTLGGLRKIPGLKVFGISDERSKRFDRRGPVITFSMRKIHHNLVAKMLTERAGMGVRNGCLCAHLFVKKLMRINELQSLLSNVSMILFPKFTLTSLPGIVRVSFGIANTDDEIDLLIRTLQEIAGEPIPIINKVFARLYYGTPFLPRTSVEDNITHFIDSEVRAVYSIK